MFRKKKCLFMILGILLLVLTPCLIILNYYNLIPKKVYTAKDFDIETVKSDTDFNKNGVDDYTDFLLGARAYVKTKPKYDGSYFKGGYPPKEIGVCTDVIWNAFKQAGYCLKDMVDQDIKENIDLYKRVNGKPDPNIDFRRVPNLMVFFERHGISLTTDPNDIDQWQPGDIITYGQKHIGIVSDKRNRKGIPYIIHNGGQPKLEEDALARGEISGHYRFVPSKTDVAFQTE